MLFLHKQKQDYRYDTKTRFSSLFDTLILTFTTRRLVSSRQLKQTTQACKDRKASCAAIVSSYYRTSKMTKVAMMSSPFRIAKENRPRSVQTSTESFTEKPPAWSLLC